MQIFCKVLESLCLSAVGIHFHFPLHTLSGGFYSHPNFVDLCHVKKPLWLKGKKYSWNISVVPVFQNNPSIR